MGVCWISVPNPTTATTRWYASTEPTQLLADVREPLPAQPGRHRWQIMNVVELAPAIFICSVNSGQAPHGRYGTPHHARLRPPDAMTGGRGLPQARAIRIVLGNLNIHCMPSSYETLPPQRPAHRQPLGGPPHSQTYQLAQHIGDRVQHLDQSLSARTPRRRGGFDQSHFRL